MIRTFQIVDPIFFRSPTDSATGGGRRLLPIAGDPRKRPHRGRPASRRPVAPHGIVPVVVASARRLLPRSLVRFIYRMEQRSLIGEGIGAADP